MSLSLRLLCPDDVTQNKGYLWLRNKHIICSLLPIATVLTRIKVVDISLDAVLILNALS